VGGFSWLTPGSFPGGGQPNSQVVSDPLLIVVFLAAAAVSLATSWLLVTRLERIGARFGLSEALLGLLAALAADAPEITATVTALVGHHARIGAGVAIGSNVFNLAALLGLTSLVAGRITLHRRVILLEGTIAVALAAITVAVVAGGLPAGGGLGLAAALLLPYGFLVGVSRERMQRLRLPPGWLQWLNQAVQEEEIELLEAIHPRRGRIPDVLVAAGAVAIVVSASVAMEQAAAKFGSRHAIPQSLTGGLILAAVTSLPNAVAGIYLARRGRGAATLSTALNSNAINVVIGLLLAGTILGLGTTSSASVLAASWYLGLTLFTLAAAYRAGGLIRSAGAVIVTGYLVFVAVLVATA
jgi:cation:H+ antiporter